MPAPSQLSIATSSVLRLLKEEQSYFKEMEQQEGRIVRLQRQRNDDENAEFQMQQEKRALEETKAIFPPLRQRIMAAAARLETQLDEGDQFGEELDKAQDALRQAKNVHNEV